MSGKADNGPAAGSSNTANNSSRLRGFHSDTAEPATGNALETYHHVPEMPVGSGKEARMWVFDGEEWTNEGGEQKPETTTPRLPQGEFVPELQVIEIVQVPPAKPSYMPPFPLP